MPLDDLDHVLVGRLPDQVAPEFEVLWSLHPAAFHEITMMGRKVRTPRWQQAFGRDYRYTGSVNRARPVPDLLVPILRWARSAVHPALDGLLVNWYDGALGHYMGPHRDRAEALVPDVPIVTVSLGASRVFRLRPWRSRSSPGSDRRARRDLLLEHHSVVVVPYAVNQRWTHEVPHRATSRGRRISVTLRAFRP